MEFHPTWVMNVSSTQKLQIRVCRIAPVLIGVCSDDVVRCVSQFVAHEAPREGARLRVSLHVNT